MPPIEVGTTRAIGAVSAELTRKAGADIATTGATAAANAGQASAPAASATPDLKKTALATSAALDPGEAPVDAERVSQIRRAIETGNYPLVPARIADAMIAAGMFLRSAKA